MPIPPLAELRRIVGKVGQLMALMDALEQKLAASRAAAANLLHGQHGGPSVTEVDSGWAAVNAAVQGFQTIRATVSLVEAFVAPPCVMK